MHRIYTILLGVFSVYLSIAMVQSAFAQADNVFVEVPKPLADIHSLKPDSSNSVSQQSGLNTGTSPIRWRGFEISPLLASSQTVDTNIYATDSNEETDTITTLRPSVQVRKSFGSHEAKLSMEGEAKKYWSNTDEDVFNFNTKLDGALKAGTDIQIPFELAYTSGHETRGQNFGGGFSKKPIAFDSFGSALGIVYNPDRLNLSLVGRYGGLSFDNGKDAASQRIVREDGDRTSTSVEATASYEVSPGHEPFVSASYGTTDYKNGTFTGADFSGPERDSENFDVLAGWKLAYKGVLSGYAGAGYATRNYDSAQIDDIDTLKIAADINWNVTKKATLNLALRRAITEDSQITQGAVLSQGRLQLDYEFLHNLFYNAFVDYAFADFQSSTREDDILNLGTGLRYNINPRWSVSGDYDYISRDSTVLSADYDKHQFMVRLHTRF